MTVKERLAADAALVEAWLDRLTAETDADFAKEIEAERYSLLAPRAKRIRPALVLECCRLFGGRDEDALPLGAALEMVHTYSLIHDDLPAMDNDDLRRGRPTCHKAYGEATAILAGDGLLTRAFGVIAECAATDRMARDAAAVLSRAAGSFGMIGGQIMDLRGETETFDLPTLKKLHAHKTGALMRAAAVLGCVAAGLAVDDARTLAVERYAAGVGLAFQIVDDVLDATADEQTAGKSVGSDAARGKTTFLTFYTPAAALAEAARVTEQAKNELKGLAENDFLTALADYLIDRKY